MENRKKVKYEVYVENQLDHFIKDSRVQSSPAWWHFAFADSIFARKIL